MNTLPELLAVARGDRPADLLLQNGRLVNVFSGEIERADLAVAGDCIAGIGPGYQATQTIDLQGAFVAPGLIDAHVHIESSLCTPAQFAAAVLPRGITCAVIDPHEIANVVGMAGVRFMAESCRRLPLTAKVMAPSCVPATHMESAGATLDAEELADLLADGTVHGLAEVMNYPGVIQGNADVLAKLAAFAKRPLDGHAPQLRNAALNAYAAAGIGSEHECTTVEEAAEKLARGLYILIREATNAHNLQALLPLITPGNSRRICFCTDDRIPGDLLNVGSIDHMIRVAIEYGIDPITAIRMATLNPAEWFGLRDRGALAPGRMADFLICDDLTAFRPRQVYAQGQLVAQNDAMLPSVPLSPPASDSLRNTVNIDWNAVNFRIQARGRRLRAIGALENQLVTEARILEARTVSGEAVADLTRDLLKIAVIERHHATGRMGLGFIQGIGLDQGALAGTVAHDHHNLIVIGADDASMWTAVRAVAAQGGGLATAMGERVTAALPLPIAGLMSDEPIESVRRGYDRVRAAAAAQGSPLHDPCMAMSFMALEVIPTLKLTDHGLVDVEQFTLVDLFV